MAMNERDRKKFAISNVLLGLLAILERRLKEQKYDYKMQLEESDKELLKANQELLTEELLTLKDEEFYLSLINFLYRQSLLRGVNTNKLGVSNSPYWI